MPIYEYHCNSCSKNFEELVFGDQPPACPYCGGDKTDKMISRPCKHHRGDGGSGDYSAPSTSSGGGCAGCSGGNCASCH